MSEKRTIFSALLKVQKDIATQGISKAQYNQHGRYKFRGIDDVLNALAPIFSAHGVLLLPNVVESEIRTAQTSGGKATNHAKVTVEFTFYDEAGDSLSRQFPGEAMDSGDKSLNKALTAAYKYFLFEALTIPVQGTEDADAETHEAAHAELVTQEQVVALRGMLKMLGKDEGPFLSWLSTQTGQSPLNSLDELHATYYPATEKALKKKVEAVMAESTEEAEA